MFSGICMAILVEIIPLALRSYIEGIFSFVINNIGGNLPVLVDPVAKLWGYRESLVIFHATFYGISNYHLKF